MDRGAQGSLFPEYPDVPGARATDTSMQVADKIASSAETLQEKALKAIKEAGALGRTADETAAYLNEDKLNIRPRCSELKRKGLIADSGARRENESENNTIVWIAKEV